MCIYADFTVLSKDRTECEKCTGRIQYISYAVTVFTHVTPSLSKVYDTSSSRSSIKIKYSAKHCSSLQLKPLRASPSSHLQNSLNRSTSAGDALLVDLTEVSDAALVGAGSHALPVHRVPAEQCRLRDRKLLHDA